jgi:hypothetical protein
MEKNIAWARTRRVNYWQLNPNDRLGAIFASPILAQDERDALLRTIVKTTGGTTHLERWLAKTALEGGIDHSFASDDLEDLPF